MFTLGDKYSVSVIFLIVKDKNGRGHCVGVFFKLLALPPIIKFTLYEKIVLFSRSFDRTMCLLEALLSKTLKLFLFCWSYFSNYSTFRSVFLLSVVLNCVLCEFTLRINPWDFPLFSLDRQQSKSSKVIKSNVILWSC